MKDHPLLEKLRSLPQDKMLTAKDIVDLGLIGSEAKLYYLRKDGRGPRFLFIPPRRYLYAPSDLIHWMEDGLMHSNKISESYKR